MESSAPNQRIDVINALRAFAALAVAWGHFVAGQGKWLSLSGKYGYLGVHIFFVISGFVIPWSLYRGRYALRDYPRFLLKRNIRLYPPYVASIAVSVLAANFVMAPLLHFPPVTVTGRSLFYHLTYLNDIVRVPWINVVYWTLAIEFQWYLVVGLMFPLLATRNAAARFAGLAGMMLAYFAVGNDRLIFHSIPIFLVGVFVFQYRVGLIGVRQMLGLIAVMVLAMLGPIAGVVAFVSVVTAMLIAFTNFHSPAMDRVGDVSYSLYLLHLPIGVALIGILSARLPYSGSYMMVLDVVGVAASLAAAWAMYQIVEKPSQTMSSAIKFRRPAAKPATAAAIAPVVAE